MIAAIPPVPPTPPTPTEDEKDVQYIDYDGSIVAQYDADEFLALSAHPSNPDHTSEGLTAQGWNWSLADAKTYVTNHGMLVIGQMYTTTDGATRIKIDTSLLPTPSTPVTFHVIQNVKNGTTIDWGDGSAVETFVNASSNTTLSHSYASAGEYTVVIAPSSNTSIKIGGAWSFMMTGSGYTSYDVERYLCVKSMHIGSNVTEIYAFMCYNCDTVTLSRGLTTVSLQYFHGLKALTSPDTARTLNVRESFNMAMLSINNGHTSVPGNAYATCYSLRKLCLPDTITTINSYGITNLYGVKRLALSNNITTINNVAAAYTLESLVIPDSFTSLGVYSFQNCHSLKKLVLGDGLTSIGQQCFENCISLKEITFGSSLVTIGTGVNTFLCPQSLETLTIPDTVTTIGQAAFRYGGALKTLVIGSGITSIGGNAFANYPVLESITIKATTPPTIASGVFGTTNNCPIYVPSGCLAAYQSATGWTAFAGRMVESNS